MKKAGVGLAAGAVAPCARAECADHLVAMASSFPKSLDTLHGSAEFWSSGSPRCQGGKFQIQLFAAGEIVPGPGVHDAVKDATVEIGFCSTTISARTRRIALIRPFRSGMNARQIRSWYRQGNGAKLMGEFFAKSNIVSFPSGNTGVQMGGWYHKKSRVWPTSRG